MRDEHPGGTARPPGVHSGSTKPELTPLADALGICADGDIAVVFDDLGVDNAPYPTVGASHGIFTGIENFGGRVPDPIANAFSGLGSAVGFLVDKGTNLGLVQWTAVSYQTDLVPGTRPGTASGKEIAGLVCSPIPGTTPGAMPGKFPVVVINHGYEQVMRGVLDQNGQELSTVFDPYQGVGDDLAVCMSWAEHGWIAVMSAYRGVPLYITTGGFPIVSSLQEVDDILRKAPEPVEPEGCLGEVTDVLRLTDIVLNTGWEVLPYNVTPDLAHVLMWGYSDGGCVTDRAVEQTGGNLATAVATIDAPTDFTVWYRDCLADQQRGPFDGGPPCCTLPGNPDPPDAGCVWCTQGQPDGGPPYPADTLCAQDQQNGGKGTVSLLHETIDASPDQKPLAYKWRSPTFFAQPDDSSPFALHVAPADAGSGGASDGGPPDAFVPYLGYARGDLNPPGSNFPFLMIQGAADPEVRAPQACELANDVGAALYYVGVLDGGPPPPCPGWRSTPRKRFQTTASEASARHRCSLARHFRM